MRQQETEDQTGTPPAMPGPRGFRFLLATGAAEGFGDTLTRALLPILAVSVLGLGTGFVGVLNSIGLAAFLLLGMPVGMLIDRSSNRRKVMGSATLARCAVLAGLAWGYHSDWITGALLLGAAVLIGAADVVFTTAQSTVVPAMVPPSDLKPAYSRLAITGQATSTAAAAAGSASLALLGMTGMILAAAASYAGSVLLQLGIGTVRVRPAVGRRPCCGRKPGAGRKSGGGQFSSGFRTLRRTPALWALTLSGCLTNAGAMLGNTVLPVFILRDLGIPPAAYAALGMVSAVAAVLGAALAPRLTAVMGLKRLRTGAALLSMPAVAAALACQWLPGPDLAWLAVQAGAWSLLVSISAVAGAEVLPRTIAPEELATVGSAQRTITLGVMPLAALLGGLAAAVAGPLPLLGAWVLLAGAAALPLRRAPQLAGFR